MLSPYTQETGIDFVNELEALATKHGFEHVFISYSSPFVKKENKDLSEWNSCSLNLCEGMIEYIENVIEQMKEKLEE